MLRGFYNAAQAMINKQRALDAISNNIANIQTAGYKKDEVVTNTFMEEMILVKGRTRLSGTFQQTYVEQAKTNLEQSNFEYTESRLICWGNMYFNIRANDGNVSNRNASLSWITRDILCRQLRPGSRHKR